jgi:glycosyltransferase involved in cell wall biosynthesis
MTGSTSGARAEEVAPSPGPVRTRESREALQRDAMPAGRVIVSCSAPRGSGGLGHHSVEIEAAVARAGGEPVSLTGSSSDQSRRVVAAVRPLVRFSAPWRSWADCVAYDRFAASRLGPAEHLIAFNGEAVAQLGAARRARLQSTTLVSANSHLEQVIAQHAKARRRHPIERSWSERLLGRNRREYASADRILCSTDYIRDSFLERGVPEERLVSFPLIADARFVPGEPSTQSGRFELVFVGALTVAKGVALLIDAVRRIPYDDLRLTLVGGWSTRGMRRFVEAALAADPRIELRPGDPLSHLHRARLCVHPTYEDGFAYAPAEALAAGVPVLVSHDTGMKELIPGARHGLVVPTGDLDALTDAIGAAYRGEILGG